MNIHSVFDKEMPDMTGFVTDLKQALFFDIETTGLSGEYHSIYLIGVLAWEDEGFCIRQWFARTPAEEGMILKDFARYCKKYSTVIHFNGDHFDLPFTEKRMQKHRISSPLSSMKSLDLYRIIRPLHKKLGMESCRQKAVERFLQIYREDMFSGGELIEVYKSYAEHPDPRGEQLLLLHNREDVEGLALIFPIVKFAAFFQFSEDENNPFPEIINRLTFIKGEIQSYQNYKGELCHEIVADYQSSVQLPVPMSLSKDGFHVKCRGSKITLRTPCVREELKYFFPDWKDYYFLVEEGYAVHKSVAQFVDKEARIKAKKDTCYAKQEGLFFRQPSEIFTPAFRQEYKDKSRWAQVSEEMFEDKEKWVEMAVEVMSGK